MIKSEISIDEERASISSNNGMGEDINAKIFKVINSYFRRRKFVVTKDPRIERDYKILSRLHRYGFKGHLEFNSEYFPNGFRFEFFQNVNVKNINGGQHDFDKYQMMPYRIKLSFRNEMIRFKKYMDKAGYNCVYNKKLSPVEQLFKSKRESCHSKRPEELFTLEDFEKQMSDYDFTQNSNDKNGNKLKCGEIKYYYHWSTKRLVCGNVAHSLNNRWVVVSNGNVDYVSSWELFDFDHNMPLRKKLTVEQQLNRMTSALKEYESKQQYEKCIRLRESIKKLTDEPKYKVYSIKHSAWWGPNNNGYTQNKANAGVYLESSIKSNESYYNNYSSTRAELII